jgi:hypothetical protein
MTKPSTSRAAAVEPKRASRGRKREGASCLAAHPEPEKVKQPVSQLPWGHVIRPGTAEPRPQRMMEAGR